MAGLGGGIFGGSSFSATKLTNGVGVAASNGVYVPTISTFTFATADFSAIGAAGDVLVVTLPAKTVVRNAYVRVALTDAAGATLTISLGRTGAAYSDYLTLAGMNDVTVFYTIGAVTAERGANLTGYDLPSWAATTPVYMRLAASVGAVGAMSFQSVTVVIEHYTIP